MNEQEPARLFAGGAPGADGPTANQFWMDLAALVTLPPERIVDELDSLSDRHDLPAWLLFVVFYAAWESVLRRDPPQVRRLQLAFEFLEQRAEAEGAVAAGEACRSMCRYLPEVIADDLDWTGFLLPGEAE